MAVRIEYVLVFVLVILLVSIVGINPISQMAKSSKGDKELEFGNFSLYDIKKNEPSQIMSATKMLKYENYLDMDEIDLRDENGYRLLAKKAIYEEELIYMDRGVNVLRDDGLKFSTKSLNYNVETKDIKTVKPFMLEFNSSIIQGQNLVLNMSNNIITADNVEAKIVFISK